jgi:hypothetical protein
VRPWVTTLHDIKVLDSVPAWTVQNSDYLNFWWSCILSPIFVRVGSYDFVDRFLRSEQEAIHEITLTNTKESKGTLDS